MLDTKGNNGLVVGPKGSTVKRIEDATGARVKCLTDKTTVEVFGSPEAVRRASDMIIDILESRNGDKGRPSGGEGDLRDRLGGKRRRDDDRNGDRGDKRARPQESLLEHLRNSAKEAGIAKEFPPEYVDASQADEHGNVEQSTSIANYIGLVIGKHGRMQAEIQRNVDIPMKIDREHELASFRGPADKVGQGLALVREVIETTNALREARNAQEEKARENDVEATIEIKGNVGAVVGKGGSTVKSIKYQLRCHFSIDRDSEIVTIRGPAEKVELGKKLVAEAIEKVASRKKEREAEAAVQDISMETAATDE